MVNKHDNKSEQSRAPVYIPFKTFLTAIETLEPGIPPVLDRSVWPSFSGGLQSQTLGAFKFLGLIKEDGTVELVLQRLVNAKGDDKKAVLREIIQSKYTGALELAKKNASYMQLEEYFRAYNVKAGTLYRIIRFFLDACAYTGEKCSTHWAKAKKTARRSPRREDAGATERTAKPSDTVQPKANITSVQLKNEAGTVSLSLSVDLTKLSSDDWKWLRELVDRMNTYGKPEDTQK